MKPFKIGNLMITPKMFLGLLLALFIMGIGIGATVASQGESKLALFMCAIISVVVIVTSIIKLKKSK